MPNEISATALLESDFGRIDEEVDRIAMAYCEARLVDLAQRRDKDRGNRERNNQYKAECQRLRDGLTREEGSAFVHLLYWLDVRADYYASHPAPPDDAAQVEGLLEHFANEAHRLQRLANRARGAKADEKNAAPGGPSDRHRNADVLYAFTQLPRPQPQS
ncbi:MAG TPA: hypothetical protein VK841_10170 [Polyangiaceae bacterium]|jgi:hypothetical protein|nr:hypothetical protein [Polyangiaceae bacterium]